jgi:hypothetical protein
VRANTAAMLADTSSAPAAISDVVGNAAAALAALIVEPTPFAVRR